MSSIPAGTVTLLFTDIEGSTKLWEAYPETMRVSLARHDALLRAAIGSSNGYVLGVLSASANLHQYLSWNSDRVGLPMTG